MLQQHHDSAEEELVVTLHMVTYVVGGSPRLFLLETEAGWQTRKTGCLVPPFFLTYPRYFPCRSPDIGPMIHVIASSSQAHVFLLSIIFIVIFVIVLGIHAHLEDNFLPLLHNV